jgi:hypothetical protein
MDATIRALRKAKVDDKAREKVYRELIPAYENEDCDTLYECAEGRDHDKVFAKVLNELELMK